MSVKNAITVIASERIPIKFWGTSAELTGFDKAIQQAKNLANHPLTEKWVGLMPDVHVGYGMPIGGVIATSGGVIPNAVGVDIGCGMIAVQLDVEAGAFGDAERNAWRREAHARIPVGNGPGGVHRQAQPMPEALTARLDQVERYQVIRKQVDRAAFQLGTLGGGNHFCELQADESDAAWLMIHSGSRNIGKQVCDAYHGEAKKLMQMFHVPLPDMDLAFLPIGVPQYPRYIAEMAWCLRYAEESRRLMLQGAIAAAEVALGRTVSAAREPVATHHNFAALERHFGRDLLIHRKGAVRAEGLVTIPGSMGTASYICEGLVPAESFVTCSHGAGRVLGRGQANRTITLDRARASMQHVAYDVQPGQFDEMPDAYKDIDRVIAAQADLVRPVFRLRPLAVIKG